MCPSRIPASPKLEIARMLPQQTPAFAPPQLDWRDPKALAP
jgi:hypothetical protein